MEPIDCSRPTDQPQQNSCHQTGYNTCPCISRSQTSTECLETALKGVGESCIKMQIIPDCGCKVTEGYFAKFSGEPWTIVDSRRIGTAVRDRVEPCRPTWERPAWTPHGVKQAASEVVERREVLTPSCLRDQPGCRVLHRLQPLKEVLGDAVE